MLWAISIRGLHFSNLCSLNWRLLIAMGAFQISSRSFKVTKLIGVLTLFYILVILFGAWCYFAVKLNQPLYCASQNSTEKIPRIPSPHRCAGENSWCTSAVSKASPSYHTLLLNGRGETSGDLHCCISIKFYTCFWYDFVPFGIYSPALLASLWCKDVPTT